MADQPIARALISVSDKTGLVEFAESLARHQVRILSTGGSAKALKDAGIAVTEVSAHTEFPEIMDGRVKTLHPIIHGGILGRRDDRKHQTQMESHGIAPIDMVVVNLYPFAETMRSGADFATCIENIDIGGPALIRAAAKNHEYVTVITDPGEYETVIADMDHNHGATTPELRAFLAREAYARTSAYDSVIARWLADQQGLLFPKRMSFAARRKQELRYGENPHQRAALYANASRLPGVVNAEQIQGKDLSYNNINDGDAAFELVCEYEEPAIVIVKHANPCGVAVADTAAAAWEKAFACDPVSAFGGVVAVNTSIDRALAEKLTSLFLEVVIAPDADDEARAVLATKGNVRVLLTGPLPDPGRIDLTAKMLTGGMLVQTRDNGEIDPAGLDVVSERQPTNSEMADLLFAWKVCKHVKSNAIVYARDGATVGIGAGQMSRVDAARIGAQKASEHEGTKPSVIASDAFFPFADGLEVAIEAGATAVIQPGGSKRDAEVVAAADAAGVAMVTTGMRHFRH